jgi:hypothetical protein
MLSLGFDSRMRAAWKITSKLGNITVTYVRWSHLTCLMIGRTKLYIFSLLKGWIYPIFIFTLSHPPTTLPGTPLTPAGLVPSEGSRKCCTGHALNGLIIHNAIQ